MVELLLLFWIPFYANASSLSKIKLQMDLSSKFYGIWIAKVFFLFAKTLDRLMFLLSSTFSLSRIFLWVLFDNLDFSSWWYCDYFKKLIFVKLLIYFTIFMRPRSMLGTEVLESHCWAWQRLSLPSWSTPAGRGQVVQTHESKSELWKLPWKVYKRLWKSAWYI